MVWDFPVGVAAGLDKDAEAIDFFANVGFGAIEVGTVTPRAQQGNAKPRVFRLKRDLSLRNSMGFPNDGASAIKTNISKHHKNIVVGINIGKNKLTPEESAIEDYLFLLNHFYKQADYIAINISSPNTPGLRDMQKGDMLNDLLSKLIEARNALGDKPLYLKISPDLSEPEIKNIVQVAIDNKLDGIIATNTTIMREKGDGGVSGKLLAKKSKEVRDQVLRLTKNIPDFEIIAVGGIWNFQDLLAFWKGGGKFVQVYTAFIYQGPNLLKDIQEEIDNLLQEKNLTSLEEFIETL